MVNINDHGCSKKKEKEEEPCPFYVKDDGI